MLPQRLEALIMAEQVSAGLCRAMAKGPGPDRPVLRRLAGDAERRARELTTLHYLLTGRRLRLKLPQPPPVGSYPEQLRQQYLQQRQMDRAYDRLAREFEGYSDQFVQLQKESRQAGKTLQNLLSRQIDRPEPRPGGVR